MVKLYCKDNHRLDAYIWRRHFLDATTIGDYVWCKFQSIFINIIRTFKTPLPSDCKGFKIIRIIAIHWISRINLADSRPKIKTFWYIFNIRMFWFLDTMIIFLLDTNSRKIKRKLQIRDQRPCVEFRDHVQRNRFQVKMFRYVKLCFFMKISNQNSCVYLYILILLEYLW